MTSAKLRHEAGRAPKAGALGWQRDGARREVGRGFQDGGTHVYTWLIHVNEWQKPSQYCKVIQFSSVAQSCPTLRASMDHSTPGLPVHHQLPEFTQNHLHWVCYAIWPSHPLPSPSPPAFNFSQHQGIFKWVSSLHQVTKVLEFQL